MNYVLLKQSCDDEYSQVYGIYPNIAAAKKEKEKLENEYDDETSIWIEKTNCKNENEYIENSI